MENRTKIYNKLMKKYFGYDKLKDKQLEIIDNLVHHKKDVCAILATGFGKSMCFQIPFLALKKCVIVISPLIALMEDQKMQMEKLNIPVCCFNSANNNKDMDQIDILDGEHKMIYITPETLVNQEHFIRKLYENNMIGLFAVDEAHCVSTWGLDFRKDYTKLYKLKSWAPNIPILAVTATATEKVRNDIYSILKLNDPYFVIGSFYRSNLDLSIKLKTENIKSDIMEILENYRNDFVIVYCKTRDDTIKVAEQINDYGINCLPYHAGQTTKERNKIQKQFMDGDIKCMVATIAFGMGINIPNIRCVIHYSCPKNIESYYQEIGRAGRDNKQSECYLFYSNKDFVVNKIFLKTIKNTSFKNYQEDQVQQIEKYIYSTGCRWQTLLVHFDEITNNCDHCDNCLKIGKMDKRDFTEETKLILTVNKYLNGKYGAGTIINILRGSDTKKLDSKFKNWSLFGKGNTKSDKWWKAMIRILINNDFLKEKTISGGFGSIINNTPIGIEWFKKCDKVLFEITTDLLNEEKIKPDKKKISDKKKIKIDVDDIVNDNDLSDTYLQTFKLYKNNKSIKEICEQRQMQKTTIDHIVKCFESEMDIDINKLGLVKSNFKLIEGIVKKLGQTNLKKIRDELPFHVKYIHIKLALVIINKGWQNKIKEKNINFQ